jgi:hypothetical protein
MLSNFVEWHFDHGCIRIRPTDSGEWLVQARRIRGMRSMIITDVSGLVDRLMGRNVVLPDWQEALIGTVMSEDGGYGYE